MLRPPPRAVWTNTSADKVTSVARSLKRLAPSWRRSPVIEPSRWAEDSRRFATSVDSRVHEHYALVLRAELFEEAVLRELLPIQLEKFANHWETGRAQFWLGAALLAQEEHDAAEAELLAGYGRLKSHEHWMPEGRKVHIN